MSEWNNICKVAKTDLDKAKNLWLSCSIFKNFNEESNNFNTIKEIIDDYSGWNWINSYNHIRDLKAIDMLNQIEQNTLIINGENDYKDFLFLGEKFEKEIKNSKRVILENAGHMVNLERAEEVNKLLLDFLK